MCVPGEGIDAAVAKGKIDILEVTKETLQRGRDVAKMLVLDNVDTRRFRNAMRAATDEAGQLYFRSLLTDDILYYLFSAQGASASRSSSIEESVELQRRKLFIGISMPSPASLQER
ncbi:hypothetical protein VC83_00563 [Pseudogymnoascus destructans]|uniref:Uncharacterized protein n=2 Tax=Pseudogymnoascus destructans TaxID=655981 RepID=L8GBU3_PSED2|nr:uncharacterized protein VC83_00563 [Pseudogymnoascus destructans]ELR09516.1 hypothetical protein GMDG_00698 [Pseudogymnoascus destructans 20631-21]OAF63190.1 hypothetical protein VC83_00563 [Pseudogymnoascus destructans]